MTRAENTRIGTIRGLEAIGARPATPGFTEITRQVHSMARADARKIAEGGDARRIRAVAEEKLKILRDKAREANMITARRAAARYEQIAEELENITPVARMAQIQDAQMRAAARKPGELEAWAASVMKGETRPRSEYELLQAIGELPEDHELSAEVKRRNDFASWTPAGSAARNEMLTYASLGDRIQFVAEDGTLVPVDVADLYSPPEIPASETAAAEMAGQPIH